MPTGQAPRRSYGDRTDTALKLFVVLTRANRAVAELVRKSLEAHDLSSTGFGVLEALHHRGPLLVGEVAEKILLTSGSTTYVIDRLEERGLIRRAACATDRRASYVELTPEGEKMITAIFPGHARAIEAAVAGLTLQEQKKATQLLRKLGLAAAETD